MRLATPLALLVVLIASQAAAQQASPAVNAALTTLDGAKLGDEEHDYSTLSETDRTALGAALLARVATPHGREGSIGRTYAYLRAARFVPQGGDVALAFLRRRVSRVVPDTTLLFDAAFDTLGVHERDGGASPTVCALLQNLIEHPAANLVRGSTPAVRLEAVALALSACPGSLQIKDDVVAACHGIAGTECDAARLRAGDDVKRRELVATALSIATIQPDSVLLPRWGQLARTFVRAGAAAPIGDLLPLLDSTVVRHVPVMYSDGPHGGSTTYGDAGIADLYVELAVEAWHLPMQLPAAPPSSLSVRVTTPAERAQVRQLVRHRVTMASPP